MASIGDVSGGSHPFQYIYYIYNYTRSRPPSIRFRKNGVLLLSLWTDCSEVLMSTRPDKTVMVDWALKNNYLSILDEHVLFEIWSKCGAIQIGHGH